MNAPVPRSRTQTNSFERKGAVEAAGISPHNEELKTSIDDTAAGVNPLVRPVEVERFTDMDQIEIERFMREPVEIHMHESQNENDPQFVEVTVNGDYRLIHRGATAVIPRSHVGVLCDAKEARVTQKKVTAQDGSMAYQEGIITRLTYPFSVINDPSGKKGADWLRNKLKQAA